MITCFLIGNGPIAVQAAEVILHAGYILCGTYSFDDSLLLWSKEQGVKYYIDLEDINSSLKSSPYDCLFSINNPWIIPADIISCARRHTINYHDSLLPKYSGLYASSWALIKGEEVHGLSFHEVVETIDAGDIYQQATINISNNDTAISLNARIHKVAIESFADLLNKISNNALQPIIQDKSQRSYYSNTDRPEAACVLSVNKTAIELHNLVRGLTFGQSNNPLGLPKLLLPHKLITIGQLNITDGDGIPGEVIDVENNYLKIAVADAVVELKGIRTVFGHSVTAQQLQEWGANKGRILSGLTTVERFAITQYNRLVCVHESKWVSRLIHLNPFVHPYCKASGGLSLPSSNVVEFSPPEDFGFNKNEWITVFVIYCLRLSQEKSIQLGLAVIDIPDKAHEIFAGVVPLSISIDGIDEPVLFEDMKSITEFELGRCEKWKTVACDVITRFSGLSELGMYPRFSTTVAILEQPEDLSLDEFPTDVLFVVYKNGAHPSLLYSDKINEWQALAIVDQLLNISVNLQQQPSQLIETVSLLGAQEKDELLASWCVSQRDYPNNKSVNALISRQAELTPMAIAVSGGNQELTYLELEHKSNQLARTLLENNVLPGQFVGLCLRSSPDLIVAILGIIKAGAAYIPIDPSYPIGRIQYIVSDSNIKTVVTQSQLSDNFCNNEINLPAIRQINLDGWDASCYSSDEINNAYPSSILYVIYTSGSTGAPKGVCIKHQSIVNHGLAVAENYGLKGGDKILQSASISFDISVEQIFPTLFSGAEIVIPTCNPLESFLYFEKFLKTKHITVMLLPTAFWHQWVVHLETFKKCAPDSLRLIGVGTEKVLGHRLDEWEKASKGQVDFYQGYGPTETTVTATMYKHQHGKLFGVEGEVSIGKPLFNVEVYIVDKVNQLVPQGIPGQLLIGGPGLAQGYHALPRLTQEKFIPNPFRSDEQEKVYQTGDLVRRGEDGDIYFVGREDDQIKIRGYRIELGEIEVVLAAHPAIQQSIVTVHNEQSENPCLVAYYVLKDHANVSENDLRHYIQNSLPKYMEPNFFVALDEMPIMTNGKIDRKQLPYPVMGLKNDECNVVAPGNDFELAILTVWRNFLGNDMGITDDFFEAGGHSILAMKVTIEMSSSTGIDFDFGLIFSHPTIKELVLSLGEDVKNQSCNIVPLQSEGKGDAIYCICGIDIYRGFADAVGVKRPVLGVYAREELAIAERAIAGDFQDISVDSLVDFYIEGIKKKDFFRPAILVGISFGGYLAIQIAQKLRLEGYDIAAVILLDTLSSDAYDRNFLQGLKYKLMNTTIARMISTFLNRLARRKIQEDVSVIREACFAEAMRRQQKQDQYYDGKVILVKSEERVATSSVRMKEDYGWGQFLSNKLDIISAPGDHLGIIKPPNVETTVNLLKQLVPEL